MRSTSAPAPSQHDSPQDRLLSWHGVRDRHRTGRGEEGAGMGLLDVFRPDRTEVGAARSALEEARSGKADGEGMDRVVRLVMEGGSDGRGPLRSAPAVAPRALEASGGDIEAAVRAVGRSAVRWGAVGGFVTGLGGFATMPVALPANLLEFYVQATRMAAAIATLRGCAVGESEWGPGATLPLGQV